ncbi:MAG TPA: helix-turn-helix domain-containing protein [Hymenobacter sp.]|jgi:HTH-type transcriptional regulator/antitoxin HigA
MSINTPQQYKEALRQLDLLMATKAAGDEEKTAEIAQLTTAVETYEERLHLMMLPALPTTLVDMIELKRQQLRLKQKDLAQLLEVPAGRLSQVLSGKRRVTLDLAKKLYERLGISPEFILKKA